MSAELIGILGVGATLLVGLGGLLLALWSRTDKRLAGLELELRRLGERVDRLLAHLGERVARIEGMMERGGRFRTADAPEPAPAAD